MDKLDNKLIDIIKIRTNLVNEVVKLKEYKNELEDVPATSMTLKFTKRRFHIWKFSFEGFVQLHTKVLGASGGRSKRV